MIDVGFIFLYPMVPLTYFSEHSLDIHKFILSYIICHYEDYRRSNCGIMQDKKKIKDSLHILHYVVIRGYPIVSTIYNTLNGGLCKAGQVDKSHILHKELLDQGHRPSNTISSILIDGLLRTNNMELAYEIPNEITKI